MTDLVCLLIFLSCIEIVDGGVNLRVSEFFLPPFNRPLLTRRLIRVRSSRFASNQRSFNRSLVWYCHRLHRLHRFFSEGPVDISCAGDR